MVYTSADPTKGSILLQDLTANDSSKPLLVGGATPEVGPPIEILGVRVELASTATVGNRLVTLRLLDGAADIIGEWDASAVQAASLTVLYEFIPGYPLAGAAVGGQRYEFMPEGLIVGNGQQLLVLDSTAVDAAADDMLVHIRARRP